ncbi:MAG: TonB-dependent receptor plug domain-containing protein, partial [Bacteroidales bacterium]|nr:TonB-dependent receptor plug domain-containing protein [Bacteroidales bacterium]
MRIKNRFFILTCTCVFLSVSLTVTAQNLKISGVVSDASTNEFLLGVTVMVRGTSNGTTTGADGKYTLVVSESDTIEAIMMGYKNATAIVKGNAEIDFSMEEDTRYLEETIVIGYGTMDKKELTSAIAHVSSKDFLSSSSMDPAMLIQGKVSGVSVVNTGAADPNNNASIQIRGISSRAAGLGPLIVIDGVPGGNMSNLNQNDIESINILKDGAASAIYGTRGSNGVVLITTKKGTSDGNVHTSYYGQVSANIMIKELDMLTADAYRENKVANNSGADYGGNVDWLKEVSRVGLTHQHTLTLSGGSSQTNYRVSTDFRDAKGIDRRSERMEYGLRASINHTTKSGLFTFTANVAPRIVKAKSADWNVFHNA